MAKILLRHQVDKVKSEIVEIEEELAKRLVLERNDYEYYDDWKKKQPLKNRKVNDSKKKKED